MESSVFCHPSLDFTFSFDFAFYSLSCLFYSLQSSVYRCIVCLHNDQNQETVFLVSDVISINVLRIF